MIGFGGGSVLIPIIERELVLKNDAISEDDYLKHTVIANITPGTLPVKLGATCGQQLSGTCGSLLAAYGVAVPSVLITVLIMALFRLLGEDVLEYFNYASVGISWFIIYLLSHYIIKTVATGLPVRNLILCLTAFLVTGGKEVREIAGMLSGVHTSPLLDISTIDLMIVTLFLIAVKTISRTKTILFCAAGLGCVYVFLAGKWSKTCGLDIYKNWVLPAMVILVCILFVRHGKAVQSKHIVLPSSVYRTMLWFLIIPVVLTLASAILSQDFSFISFIVQVCVSTMTSFGGGEAYVSVADGIFVQGGYISPEAFYTRLLPVANALPGPILVKIAAGIGFVYGYQIQPVFGWVMALAATTASIGACSAIAVLLIHIYDNIRESELIKNLQRYILSVICGMLISTSCAMLYESMKITAEKGIGSALLIIVSVITVGLLFLINKRKHINDLIWILALSIFSTAGIIGLTVI